MSKTYDQLHEAAKSGRSDMIGAAVEDWLNGVSTTEELHDIVATQTCTPKSGEASTPQANSATGASCGR